MKGSERYLGFDDKWLLIIGIPLVSLIFSSVLFGGALVEDKPYFVARCLPISLMYTSTYWIVFRFILIEVRKRVNLNHDVTQRVSVEVIVTLVVFFLLKPMLTRAVYYIFGDHDPMYRPDPSIEVFASLLFTFLILAIYEIIFIHGQLVVSRLEQVELARVQAESQLAGLKSQIQPHFLFNSLNTLAGLIPIDEDRAIKYVQQLSKVFRYVLEISNEPIIPVSRELEFLYSYVYLMKERFAENLVVHIDVPEEYRQCMIVPLSLQILFENAVKHNSFGRDEPLHVTVKIADGKRIVVENDLRKKTLPESSTMVGLENIKRRYRFFGDEQIEITSNIEKFIVALPLISKAEIGGEV